MCVCVCEGVCVRESVCVCVCCEGVCERESVSSESRSFSCLSEL